MHKILIIDFGGQYNMLIARRVRELHVYAEIKPYSAISVKEIISSGYDGIILTGGPNSVYDPDSPHFDRDLLNTGIPVLGICYGAQLIAFMAEGKVSSAESGSEYGRTEVNVKENILFKGIPLRSVCWMSHRDYVSSLPEGYEIIARSDNCPVAAFANDEKKIYGVQFHPEVTHSEYGRETLSNFIFEICKCKPDWVMDDFIAESVDRYRKELKDKRVLLALSGGVDSSVAAVLLNKAIGDKLVCVFVDHGLLRKNEGDYVVKTFKDSLGLNLIRVNAKERFLSALKGVRDPERKRKIIGEQFIRTFEDESKNLGEFDYLAQGTIYPDVIESGKGDSAVIKSHHNVGGLPDVMSFKGIVEPLRDLFKDEVREVGRKLGIEDKLVDRQPFPGPGLAVRIIGEITEEKIRILQEVDAICREEIEKAGLTQRPAQYFAVLTDSLSVGVTGDSRTYGYTVAIRAVDTSDFMTAEWSRLPYDLLGRMANRIVNEVEGISRAVYDITSKPPGTVEWE